MSRVRFIRVPLAGLVCFVVAGALGLAGQAKPTNLFKQVEDSKAKIVWKNAPAGAIPEDVCTILQACGVPPDKLIALPKATEGGLPVARGLFLSHTSDAKKADMVILLRQTPTDAYFFAVAADGELQKAAYWSTGKAWIQMGTALSKPTFEKDKQMWLDHIARISEGAAAAAPAPQG